MKRTMVALLEPTEEGLGETTQEGIPCSATEREVLDLLRRPARSPPGGSDLHRELYPCHSLLEIQKSIFGILDKGVVELLYKYGFDLGFGPASQETD